VGREGLTVATPFQCRLHFEGTAAKLRGKPGLGEYEDIEQSLQIPLIWNLWPLEYLMYLEFRASAIVTGN